VSEIADKGGNSIRNSGSKPKHFVVFNDNAGDKSID